MISNKADVNKRDAYGETPVMIAADKGCLQAIEVLVDAGADISIKTKKHESALTFATEYFQKVRKALQPTKKHK